MKYLVCAIGLTVCAALAPAQQAPTEAPLPPGAARPQPRPPNPTRDPHTPGYVAAKELPDGTNAPANEDRNFILGPAHPAASEMTAHEGIPHGAVYTFTMESKDSRFYPGIFREPNTVGTADAEDPEKFRVPISHPGPWTRRVAV